MPIRTRTGYETIIIDRGAHRPADAKVPATGSGKSAPAQAADESDPIIYVRPRAPAAAAATNGPTHAERLLAAANQQHSRMVSHAERLGNLCDTLGKDGTPAAAASAAHTFIAATLGEVGHDTAAATLAILDGVDRTRTTATPQSWLHAIEQSGGLAPEQAKFLRDYVSAAPPDPGAAPFFLGPGSFDELVDWRARIHRHIPAHEPELQRRYESLPKPLQSLVDNRARIRTIATPDATQSMSSSCDWIRAPDVRDGWAQREFERWARAGIPAVRHERIDVENAIAMWRSRNDYSHLWGGNTRLPPELERKQRAIDEVLEGRAIARWCIPDFAPQPVKTAEVRELARGIIAAPCSTLRGFYEPYLEQLEFEGPGTPQTPPSLPPSLRALWPRLRAIKDPQLRREALPWMLLEYMTTVCSLRRQPGSRVDLEDLRNQFDDKEPLEGFYVEIAPDYRTGYNRIESDCGGSLDSQALEAISKFAPALLPFVGKKAAPPLDAIDEVIARHPGEPLAGVNILAVQHLLADNETTLGALSKLGADPKRVHIVGVPYSTNEAVAQRLRHQHGYDVDTSFRRDLPYDAWREVQVCGLIRKALADHARNGKPIVVMDDGGYVTKNLHKRFPEQAHLFTIVEQTTRGITAAKAAEPLRCDVISVARSDAKKVELPGVQRAIEEKVTRRLSAFSGGPFLPGRPAMVLGYGWIGGVVAAALRKMGREVVVVDPSPESRAQAEADGYQVSATADGILEKAAIIGGCSGHNSLTPEQIARLRDGQVLFSASSSNVEYELPSATQVHRDMVVNDGTSAYVVLGSGFPINFDGDAVVGEPRYLQFTCAAMLEGVLQAASSIAPRTSAFRGAVVALEPQRAQAISRSTGRIQGHTDDGVFVVRGVRARTGKDGVELFIDDLEREYPALFALATERDRADKLSWGSPHDDPKDQRNGWLSPDEMRGAEVWAPRNAWWAYRDLVKAARDPAQRQPVTTAASTASPTKGLNLSLRELLLRRTSG